MKRTIRLIDIRTVARLILFLSLRWAAAVADGDPTSSRPRATRILRSPGEMCIAVGGDGAGREVTVDVTDKHGWLCDRRGASCRSCASNAARRIPSRMRGIARMCRQIGRMYYQLTAPEVVRGWLLGIGFRDGSCKNAFGVVDRYIDMDLVGVGSDHRGGRSFDKMTSHLPEGHPCLIESDLSAGECREGLTCLGPHRATYGLCTRLAPYAEENGPCLVSLGSEACVAGCVCRAINARGFVRGTSRAGAIRTGICAGVVSRSAGVGGDPVGWYPDYSIHECVESCDEYLGGFCGGVAERWEEKWLYDTADACCTNKLWWKTKMECVPGYIWN